MALTTPDWLKQREGELKAGLNPATWHVLLNGHPQYRLFATTAGGKYTCAITQTINGKRLDSGKHFPTLEESLKGGLEELREKLGW